MPPQQIPCSHTLADSFSLFALFSTLASFVFNSLRTLFAKHRGWGYLWGIPAPSAPLRYHLPFFVGPLFSSTYKSLLVTHRSATLSVFRHLQIPFPATSLYSHLYKTPGCGIQIMVNHRLSHARPGGGSFFRGIKEFDSYERNFALESGCWSIIRATSRAAQPREIRPNTRVKDKGCDRTVPKTGRGRSRRNERGLSTK